MFVERHMAKLMVLLLVLQTVISGLIVLRLDAMSLRAPSPSIAARLSPETVTIDLDDRPARGAEAPVMTLVEFSDVTCTACQALQPILDSFLDQHGNRVRHVVQSFPLRPEGKSMDLALAAECAHRQDGFWPMQDALFDLAPSLSTSREIHDLASDLGLDGASFADCLDAPETQLAVQRNVHLGRQLAVDGTPTLFINGQRFQGLPTAEDLAFLLASLEAAWSK